MEIKKWKKFNEDFNTSVETMSNTTVVYNKYKGKVSTMVKSEDLNKSAEEFDKFINGLNDQEKEASDLLRTAFNAEMIKAKIDLLEQNKKDIEEEIKNRMEELKSIQGSLSV